MASALASRMLRLVIGGKLAPSHCPAASLTVGKFYNKSNNSLSRPAGTAPSSLIALNIIENVGIRSLSSVATSQVIDANNSVDFGATSTLSPLLTQAEAENFAAFTYANRHQKGEIMVVHNNNIRAVLFLTTIRFI